VPELYDVDRDGDLDLFIGDASGRIAFFKNDGSTRAPHFTLVSDDYLGRRGGRRVVPRLVDLNGDGIAEVVLGTEQGGRDSTLGVVLPAYAAPAFADLWGRGAKDLFVGNEGGGVLYYRQRHFLDAGPVRVVVPFPERLDVQARSDICCCRFCRPSAMESRCRLSPPVVFPAFQGRSGRRSGDAGVLVVQ
jgi:hypothetical protein